MKNTINVFGIIAFVVVIAFSTAACSKKGGGGSSGGGGKATSASDFSYDLTADGKGILIKGYTGKSTKIVVPAKIEDLPVTEIGDDAFNGNTLTINVSLGEYGLGSKKNERSAITSITIPNTVTTIGSSAFGYTAITKFNMPDSVTKLGSGVFSGCEQLTELRLSDNIEYLYYDNMFGSKGKALKKVNLPQSLKRITGDVFSYCGELSDLVIPTNLKSVEFGKFYSRGYLLKYPPNDDKYSKWVREGEKDEDNEFGTVCYTNAFSGCSKLPIKTRQIIKDWGYKGEF